MLNQFSDFSLPYRYGVVNSGIGRHWGLDSWGLICGNYAKMVNTLVLINLTPPLD